MITLEKVQEARRRLDGSIRRTPCVRSDFFSKALGADVLIKLESLHHTGSFKERGALNRILTLDDAERGRGLIAASAGNHAQAVAYHASRLDVSVVVVMPKLTPLIKVSNTRRFGAEVILEGDSFDAAVAHARRLEADRGLTFVHPFDDPRVIAGQGTIALELFDQAPEIEALVVPIGGGGLISGIALAYKALSPKVQIFGVQTQAVPSMVRSLEAGDRRAVGPARTIADGIAVKQPGQLTLPIVQRHVDDVVTVDEEEIASAILLLLERDKTVAEGAGAAALAALYHGHLPQAQGKRTGIVLSGGNIDVNLLSRIIERGLSKDGRLVRLDLEIVDRPGALAQLVQQVADMGANVLEVHHQRVFDVGVGNVEVELKLETRGPRHVEELYRQLRREGYEF